MGNRISQEGTSSPPVRAAVGHSRVHPPSTLEIGVKRVRWSFLSLLLLVLPVTSAFAQTRFLTGRVTTESSEPLAAASVGIIGTSTGTYTDDQGRFSLTVPTGPVTIRVRRIGYVAKTVTVESSATTVAVALAR